MTNIKAIPGYLTANEAREITMNKARELYYSLPDAKAKRAAQHLNAIKTNGISEHDCATDHCPQCGSYEGSPDECPECGYNEHQNTIDLIDQQWKEIDIEDFNTACEEQDNNNQS